MLWTAQTRSRRSSATSPLVVSSDATAGANLPQHSVAPTHADVTEVFKAPGPAWDQGDIVEAVYFPGPDCKLPAVLVTPACDLEHGSPTDLWTFVALRPDAEVAGDIVQEQGSARGSLSQLMKQRYYRYHWLPVSIGASLGHVADFAIVTSLPMGEITKSARRLYSMNSSWREQLPARYAAYIGRIGVDDYGKSETQAHLDRLLGSVSKKS